MLLELVIGASKRGETPEGIVRSYRTLHLADVYAVISRYLANPAPFEAYLASATNKRHPFAARSRHRSDRGRVGKNSWHRQGKGLDPVNSFLVDQNFNEQIVDGLTRRDAWNSSTFAMRIWRRRRIHCSLNGRPHMV